MKDDLILFGEGLDQPIPDDGDTWVMERVNQIIQDAVEKKNPEIALNACRNLVIATKLSGKALAKILHTLYRYWDDFDTADDFWDTVYLRIGFNRAVVERYVRVGALLTEGVVPEDILPKLEQRNIGEMIPIANTIAQGYKIDPHEWNELVNEPDARSISRKLLEIRGEEPRKYGLRIYLDGDGSIWTEVTGENRKFVGHLEIEIDEPTVQRAINRIVDHAGIIR